MAVELERFEFLEKLLHFCWVLVCLEAFNDVKKTFKGTKICEIIAMVCF